MNNNEISKCMGDLFPDNIPDESAALLRDFLAGLTLAVESRYLHQLMRHSSARNSPLDPQSPWRTKVPDD